LDEAFVELNADFSQRVAVHAARLPWVASPIAGVERRMLDRIGDEVLLTLSRPRGRDVHCAGRGDVAEAVEEVDSGPVEALRATGASALQTVVFAVLPQALPAWIAATLYRFEVNLRASTILGMVGAGGIGFELYSSMKLFQYQDTAARVIVILALVMSADYLSSKLRARVLEG
jgi:hypothetical protein